MIPSVSIVIPIYNVGPWLRQCVDSVLGQTLRDIEVILVDDGSSDGCPAICDEYAAKDNRVQVIHKENGGLVSAWTAGLRVASAPWVGFVDGDDWVDPEYFGQMYATALKTGADMVMAELVEHTPEGDRHFDREQLEVLPKPDGGRHFLARYYAAAPGPGVPFTVTNSRCTKLYRRQLFLDNLCYFSPEVWHGEDLMANTAVMADCGCVALLAGGPKYHYMKRESSLSFGKDTGPFTDRWAENERAFLAATGRIVRDKTLLPDCFYSFLGYTAYAAVVNYLSRREATFAAKRRYARQIVELAPSGSLSAYARERGSLSVRLLCALLQARLVTPCVLICTLFTRVIGERHDA